MAHFAQLDENNIVIQVIVVHNNDCLDENGNESETKGIEFCKTLLGQETRWVQTSYNNNFRERYAGIGYKYDESIDMFIPPSPYPSWIYNTETHNWESPIPKPSELILDHEYKWNEETRTWDSVLIDFGDIA